MSESALKLTTYFGERARVGKRLVADELLDVHARHAIRLSVLLRGIQGFGAKHRLRTDRLLTLSEDLPLVSVAIDTRERIETLRQDLAALGGEGLVTVESARAADSRDCGSASRRGDGGGAPGLDPASLTARLPARSEVKLTVCLGRHEHVAGEPAFVAVCRALRQAGVSGATVLLGVDGTIRGERRRARFFARNLGVPLLVVSVGSLERVDRALASLAGTLPSLLFAIERVCLCKRDGKLLRPPGQDRTAGLGGSERQKLTIVISEAARHRGHPVYLELVRRLRAQRAAGATSLRGIWGFHGEHAPHGDRLLSLRRHVPVITEVIDAPERIAALFGIVDELTSERGLVTSESVPVSAPL
jgi:PII-like signaling protein